MQVFTRLEGERLVLSIRGEVLLIQINNAEYGRARIGIISASKDVVGCNEEIARNAGYSGHIDALIAEDERLWTVEQVPVRKMKRRLGSIQHHMAGEQEQV